MKHRVAELEGSLLDAAVAKAEGRLYRLFPAEGQRRAYCESFDGERWDEIEPSRFWSDGGPLIERENIAFLPASQVDTNPPFITWRAAPVGYEGTAMHGPTHLIAAMRAYVASKFGDEVELP